MKTLATNATHAGGYAELDVHNMFGMMEEKTTHLALLALRPDKRPFLVSRSTFPSSGVWTGHWLGDNTATWAYLAASIQGILQFQLFQIPMVGADTCGFQENTDEELCNRWMGLSAWTPFYRNHNQRGALSQEPYRWDTVANTSRAAIRERYKLLPYWVCDIIYLHQHSLIDALPCDSTLCLQTHHYVEHLLCVRYSSNFRTNQNYSRWTNNG